MLESKQQRDCFLSTEITLTRICPMTVSLICSALFQRIVSHVFKLHLAISLHSRVHSPVPALVIRIYLASHPTYSVDLIHVFSRLFSQASFISSVIAVAQPPKRISSQFAGLSCCYQLHDSAVTGLNICFITTLFGFK